MSIRSKVRASKARKKLNEERKLEREKLNKNAERLKELTAGFARTERKAKHIKQYEASKMPKYPTPDDVSHLEEEERWTMGPQHRKVRKETDPEMQRRDEEAHARTKEMKKRVGPAYNKGPIQLLSEGELAAERNGELRRRS